MFSKALLVALLSLSIVTYAAPANNKNNANNGNEDPNDVCIVSVDLLMSPKHS